ncbi:hypothetical protein BH10ACT3_BH10ACT3_04430 [soil metagenome]
MLLPKRCVICRIAGRGLCDSCAATLSPAPDLAPPPGLASCRSLFLYEGSGKDVVAALKFDNHRDAVQLIGTTLALLADASAASFDAVTWAPTTTRRRRDRGYDQSELLARAVASALGLPCNAHLQRAGDVSQTGRTRAERLDGPQFVAVRRSPPHVLLVDDVRTTGSTLCAAADTLTEAGATEVHGVTLAVTL